MLIVDMLLHDTASIRCSVRFCCLVEVWGQSYRECSRSVVKCGQNNVLLWSTDRVDCVSSWSKVRPFFSFGRPRRILFEVVQKIIFRPNILKIILWAWHHAHQPPYHINACVWKLFNTLNMMKMTESDQGWSLKPVETLMVSVRVKSQNDTKERNKTVHLATKIIVIISLILRITTNGCWAFLITAH